VVEQLRAEVEGLEVLHRQHEAAEAERLVADVGVDDHDVAGAQLLRDAVARRKLAEDPPV
jgi:hypothetical protein